MRKRRISGDELGRKERSRKETLDGRKRHILSTFRTVHWLPDLLPGQDFPRERLTDSKNQIVGMAHKVLLSLEALGGVCVSVYSMALA